MVRARFSSVLLALFFVACGGSERGAAAPDGESGEASSESSSDGASSDASEDDESSETSEAAPAKPSCDDGTCTMCGDALCPKGWYCDETAPGGPACGWLPECAEKASCACVKKAFKGCACEEGSGGARISCG
jgi:hypothetical protein